MMKVPKTRIKVMKKYVGETLVATEYHPQKLETFLFFKWWGDPNGTLPLKYLKIKTCQPEYKRVWEDKEWVESFVLWWRDECFKEHTYESDYYDWPEDQ